MALLISWSHGIFRGRWVGAVTMLAVSLLVCGYWPRHSGVLSLLPNSSFSLARVSSLPVLGSGLSAEGAVKVFPSPPNSASSAF